MSTLGDRAEVSKARVRRRRFHVDKEKIATAVKRDSHHCMIADAIKEQIKGATFIMVDAQTIRFTQNGKRYTYLTPPEAQWNLIKFDQGMKVKPFSFELRKGIITEAGLRPKKSETKRPYRGNVQRRISKFREYGMRTMSK